VQKPWLSNFRLIYQLVLYFVVLYIQRNGEDVSLMRGAVGK